MNKNFLFPEVLSFIVENKAAENKYAFCSSEKLNEKLKEFEEQENYEECAKIKKELETRI